MASLHFNANEVAPDAGFTVLPKGKYSFIITATDTKQGKLATDLMIQFTAQVTNDGPQKGQKASGNMWVKHSNPQAESIGRGRLSALCHATGVMQMTDTTQLHGRPFMAEIDVRREKKPKKAGEENKPDEYSEFNDFDAFFYPDGRIVTGGTGQAQPTQAAPSFAAPPGGVAPAPAGQPAPAPAPAPAAPAPQPQPQPVAVVDPQAGKKYFMAANNQVIPGDPVGPEVVRARPDFATLQINEAGTQAWVAATTIALAVAPAPAPAPAPAAVVGGAAPAPVGTPPWMAPGATA